MPFELKAAFEKISAIFKFYLSYLNQLEQLASIS